MAAEISVVIPTYDGARFIREALESVFKQTLLPQEIIVVDDASQDETCSIVASMIPVAPVPLRLIQSKTNSGGPARPLNRGIGAASGELIAVLDQDDVFLPDKLKKQVSMLVSYPETVFVFSYCGDYDKPDQMLQSSSITQKLVALSKKTGDDYYQIAGKDVLRLLMTKEGCYIHGYPGFIFRRKDWQRKGGVEESLRINSDYEFLCWLSLQGSVGFIPEIFYLHRKHETNLCNQIVWMVLDHARVKARYLPKEKWLFCDRELEQFLEEEFFHYARHCRDAKHYSLALEFLRLYGCVWGWGRRVLFEILKLLPHKLLSDVTNRPPVYSDFTKSLDKTKNLVKLSTK